MEILNIQDLTSEFSAMDVVLAMLLSFLLSAFIGWIYKITHRGTSYTQSFVFTLVLNGMVVALVMMIVGSNIARAFSLVGALSIIRFRTPIKEPEEVGFIMLVIAASISSATFNFRFLVILYVVAFISLLPTRGARGWSLLKRDGIAVLTLPAGDAQAHMAAIEAVLAARFNRHRLESASVRDGIATYQYVFSGLKAGIPELQAELAGKAPVQALNLFLDRPGGIR